MPKTPDSGAAPYAAPADFLARVDARACGDWVRDDGTEASAADLASDPNLAAALADASGVVEAHCSEADRYSPADLQALTGNSKNLLVRIVCGLAVEYLRGRRAYAGDSPHPLYADALRFLEKLREGTMIFGFAESEQAGLGSVAPINPADFYANMPTLLANNPRAFGVRSDRRGGFGGSGGFGGPGYGW